MCTPHSYLTRSVSEGGHIEFERVWSVKSAFRNTTKF